MADNSGILLPSTARRPSSDDRHPIALSREIAGAPQVVATLAQLRAFLADEPNLLTEGMLFTVTADPDLGRVATFRLAADRVTVADVTDEYAGAAAAAGAIASAAAVAPLRAGAEAARVAAETAAEISSANAAGSAITVLTKPDLDALISIPGTSPPQPLRPLMLATVLAEGANYRRKADNTGWQYESAALPRVTSRIAQAERRLSGAAGADGMPTLIEIDPASLPGKLALAALTRPDGTVVIPIHIDTATGRVVADVQAVHDFAGQLQDAGPNLVAVDLPGDVVPYGIVGETIVLGYDPSKQSLVGAFPDSPTAQRALSAAATLSAQVMEAGAELVTTLSAEVVPYAFVGDAVVLGFDPVKEELVGAWPETLTSIATPTRAPRQGLAPSEQVAVTEVCGMVVDGQSLSQGYYSSIVSVSQPYQNLTFSAGPRSTKDGSTGSNPGTGALAPLVENSLYGYVNDDQVHGETPCSGAANSYTALAIRENGLTAAQAVVFASAPGHDGYTINQLKKGSAWYRVLSDHLAEAPALFAAQGRSFAWNFMPWVQGETDAANGKGQGAYTEDLIQLRRDAETEAQAATGQNTPLYMLTYQTTSRIKISTGTALGQLDAARRDPRIILAGPIYHLPRAPDGLHLTGESSKWLGAQMGKLAKQIALDKVRPVRFDIVSATAVGTSLTVQLSPPWLPVRIDVHSVGAATQYGFRVVDDGGDVALADIKAVADRVTGTLARPLGANPRLRYGLDYLGDGMSISTGASGNVRDSDPATAIIDAASGDVRPLYNWLPAFEQAIAALG
jgi:hypothetical protein